MTLTDTRPRTDTTPGPDTVLSGIILDPGTYAPDPPPDPAPRSYGWGRFLLSPLRSAAWLALAACMTATLIPLIALWATATPRRAALAGAASLALAASRR
jgi:hypothetical protein